MAVAGISNQLIGTLMAELTDLLSAIGLMLFGIAAIIAAISLLRLLPRVDRVLKLVEMRAITYVPAALKKLIGG